MPKREATPSRVADQIRRMLKNGGSIEHAEGVQWFFQEEIKSHGWYATALRKAAAQVRRNLAGKHGMDFVVHVADKLFFGQNLEEKIFAVFLLEKQTQDFGDDEFHLFASWLDRITSWADHDALVHDLLGPMVVSHPARCREVFLWAKSSNRWHRRAACVALIRGVRQRLFFPQIKRLSNQLLRDEDDTVQKGLGWLLRETAKADPKRIVPYLMKIRESTPRRVLRTACETLPLATRRRILQSASLLHR